MNGKYIVVSTGFGKNGKPYSRLQKIVSGVKENGMSYAFLDDKTPIYEDEILEICSIHSYEVTKFAG